MSFLREPGDLSRTPLAAILLEAWNLRASGELTVHQPGGDSRLFFRDGMAVGAQTFAGFHPLGQILLGRGLIDIDTLGRSLADVAQTKRKQGDLLVEMGAVPREVVDSALEDQQAGYLSLIAGLAEGGYEFRFDAPIPAWAGRVLVAPMRAVVDALATPQGAPLCTSALELAEGPIALGAGYADLSMVFAWTAAEEQLLLRLGTASTAQEILATPGLPVEQARAVLAALLLLGLAEPAGEVFDVSSITQATEASPPATRMMPAPARPPLGHVPPVLQPVGSVQPAGSAPQASALPAADPSRRSDPEVARARRHRLLARAMQNMGVGPFAAGRPPPATGAAPGGAGDASTASPGARPPARPTEAEAEIRRALLAALPLAREADLFVRLNLPRTATPEEVKGAYLALVKQFHPDRFGAPALSDLQDGLRELLSALNEAYGVLSDRTRRTDYLARTSAGGRAPTEAAAAAARADFLKAEVARKSGDHARARLFLESAVRSDRSPELLVALAVETMASGKPADREKARGHLDEAMKDAGCAAAFLVAGKMCRDEGDHDRAERHFRAALRADPRSEEAARELRQLQGRRQSRAEARADAKK
jgi:curved DNA-binding protein CbpA